MSPHTTHSGPPLARRAAALAGFWPTRPRHALIGIFVLFAGTAACRLPQPTIENQNRLVVSVISPPRSFNPVMARETSTTDVTDRMFIGLTREDGVTGEILPHLASAWDASEGGRTWTFTLREGLRWSDGEPLTAHDVKFTYDRLYLNPAIPASGRDILVVEGQSPEVTVLSDTQVQFRYPEPYAPFPQAASLGILPRHVLEETADAGLFESAWGVGVDPASIVVNGPFQLERYHTGQRVVLKRNPEYYETDDQGQRLPYLDLLQFEVVQSRDVEIQKFRLGELDLVTVPGQYYPLLSPVKERFGFDLAHAGPQTGINFLTFNMNTGAAPETGRPYLDPVKAAWFNDVEFRRAVSYAIDREEIVRIVMNNLGVPVWGPMSPSQGPFYNPHVRQYPYDPDRARRILDEAGYVDRSGDGIRQDPDGNPVRFLIVTNAGNDQRVQMAQLVRRDLANVGLQVGFNQMDFNTMVNQISFTFDWEAIVIGFTGGAEPHSAANMWMSSGGLHMWHPVQESPQRPWEEEIDRIFVEAVREVDLDRRRELYFRWQEIAAEQLPLIYLPNAEIVFGIRDRLENVEPGTLGSGSPLGGLLHNVERIRVRDLDQEEG